MRIGAHAARSNIHIGSSSARHTAAPSRLHRATLPLAFSTPYGSEQYTPPTDATDKELPVLRSRGCSGAVLYNTIRPHASLGYKPPAPEVFVPTLWRRHWLRDGNPND